MTEKEAVSKVIKLGRVYGFGNLIAWLKKEWVKSLISSGLTIKAAEKAADVDPYPQSFDPFTHSPQVSKK